MKLSREALRRGVRAHLEEALRLVDAGDDDLALTYIGAAKADLWDAEMLRNKELARRENAGVNK